MHRLVLPLQMLKEELLPMLGGKRFRINVQLVAVGKGSLRMYRDERIE